MAPGDKQSGRRGEQWVDPGLGSWKLPLTGAPCSPDLSFLDTASLGPGIQWEITWGRKFFFFFFGKLQGARGVPGLIDQPVMTSGRKELRIKQEMLRRSEGQTGIPKNKGPKENAASLG